MRKEIDSTSLLDLQDTHSVFWRDSHNIHICKQNVCFVYKKTTQGSKLAKITKLSTTSHIESVFVNLFFFFFTKKERQS